MPKNKNTKGFKNSLSRLLKSIQKWKFVLIISMLLAFTSAILSLITPDKLSDLTNVITEGMIPNVSETVIKEIYENPNISLDDKNEFTQILEESKNNSDSNSLANNLERLPNSIYEIIKPSINMAKVKNIVIFILILYAISAICSYIQGFTIATVTNEYAKELRHQISNKINTLPLKYFDGHETGDILSRITNDVDIISTELNQSLGSLVTNISLFLGSIIMMFTTNIIMALAAILASLVGFSLMALILKNSQKYFNARQKELGKLNGYIEEIYSGHSVIKTYNAEEKINKNFDKLNENLFEANRKSQFLAGLMPPIMGFVGNLGYVAVCVVGALLVINGNISFGVIVAFMIYVRLFTNPLSQLAQGMASVQSTIAASDRVFEFLDEPEMTLEKDLKRKVNDAKGTIEFKNVTFSYDKSRKIIKNFNAKIKPGQKVAIVGPTGAGKTTIVNLLMKFYEIDDGDIIIDGTSIKDLKREALHDLFVMVLQDTWLFEGSIRDNIKFNQKNVNDKQIWSVAKTVGVDHFIKTLPGTLDYQITDSDSISQGQKQLLTIARGMIKDAPFLILDEATSNVDTRTEELVQKAMDKLTIGKTSFIIAHRLSTIKNADIIFVLKDGNIIESGNHKELMKQKGYYYELYNSQFEL